MRTTSRWVAQVSWPAGHEAGRTYGTESNGQAARIARTHRASRHGLFVSQASIAFPAASIESALENVWSAAEKFIRANDGRDVSLAQQSDRRL